MGDNLLNAGRCVWRRSSSTVGWATATRPGKGGDSRQFQPESIFSIGVGVLERIDQQSPAEILLQRD